MVCIINPIERKKISIINDIKKLENYFDTHSSQIWVGYNCRHYDQYIQKALLTGFDAKEVNDFIIKEKKKGWQFSNLFSKIQYPNYDVFKIATDRGLKVHEAFMGQDIQECSVPFDLERPLTEEEIKIVEKYCMYDVEQTMNVFSERKADFEAVLGIIKMFKMPLHYISKTETQLSAIVLDAQKPREARNDDFNMTFPSNLELGKYEYVRSWYCDKNNHNYKKYQDSDIAGVPHRFGWGGIHGALKKYNGNGIFILMDVDSYYPAAIIEYDFMSRNVSESGKLRYRKMRDERIIFKEQKDPRAHPLKITLNKVFGGKKDKYNALFDPKKANDITVGGQLLILDLIEKVESFCDIIQSNTDGLLVKLRNEEDFERLDDVAYLWEQRTKMRLSFVEYNRIYQKDVNNYLAIEPDGKMECVGTYVKEPDNLDYDLVVVRDAMVNFMAHEIPIKDTVLNAKNIRDFQKVVKISNKYLYGVHNGKKLNDKVFRVFASKDTNDTYIGKQKEGKERPEKFANTPENCFIDNGYVLNKKVEDYPKLDFDWYISLAEKRLLQYGVTI